MGHLMFSVAVVAACLLWSAACVAAAARSSRPWLRRLLVVVAVAVPVLSLLPFVGLTGLLAFGAKLETNWFAATFTVALAALIGGVWIVRAGLTHGRAGGFVAAAWPVVGLAAMCGMANAVACGTLLCIDNAVAAEGRALRAEAGTMMLASLPPQPLPDDDAAPLYVRAARMIEQDDDFSQQNKDSPLTSPTADVQAAAVTELLARHAATLDLLRRAADRPGCRFVRDWSRPSISMLLPEIQGLRHAAKLLALAARRAADDGDATAAIRDILRIQRMGVHAAIEPILICGLVAQAIDSVAIETLASVLPALTKEDLSLIDGAEFRDFVATPLSYARHFLGEEAFGLATFADLADSRTDPSLVTLMQLASGPAQPAFSASWAPLSLLFRAFLLPADIATYRKCLGRYQALTARLSGPEGERSAENLKQAEAFDGDEKLRRGGIVSTLMVPALASVLKTQTKGRAKHEAAEVLVAATRARLATGSIPESLDALAPQFLPKLPRDPFTPDKPLRTKRADGALVVYSVGPDGEDDGGPPRPGDETPAGNDDVGLRLGL